MADFASAARNAPSEDGECWQRVELGIHGLRSWGRNWSRKVRETWNSGGLQGHEGETGHLLSGTRETWLAPNDHLATLLPPHAPRLTLNARGSRRACRMAMSRNACSLIALPDFPEFAQAVSYGVPGTLAV